MPELPELRRFARDVNRAAWARTFLRLSTSTLTKLACPTLPPHWKSFSILAEARGKEMRLTLTRIDTPTIKVEPVDEAESTKSVKVRKAQRRDQARQSPRKSDLCVVPSAQDGATSSTTTSNSSSSSSESDILQLTFGLGMTGDWLWVDETDESALPRHAHLRFHSPSGTLCFVDPRRFGSWRLGSWSGPAERSPDPVDEYEAFCQNIHERLSESVFSKSICVAMLDQRIFNGIGNYLRAEILHRLQIKPFACARTVLLACEPGEGTQESISSGNRLLAMCRTICQEVLDLDMPNDTKGERRWSDWLQCYGKLCKSDDGAGRTIWFASKVGDSNGGKGGKRRKIKTKQTKTIATTESTVTSTTSDADTSSLTSITISSTTTSVASCEVSLTSCSLMAGKRRTRSSAVPTPPKRVRRMSSTGLGVL